MTCHSIVVNIVVATLLVFALIAVGCSVDDPQAAIQDSHIRSIANGAVSDSGNAFGTVAVARRESAIRLLVESGAFSKIDLGRTPPAAWAGTDWAGLSTSTRHACMRALCLRHMDIKKSLSDVHVLDSNGKSVGRFDVAAKKYVEGE